MRNNASNKIKKQAGRRSFSRAMSGGIRLILAATFLLGPMLVLAFPAEKLGVMPKRGAGFVLFVSLQRQSMS